MKKGIANWGLYPNVQGNLIEVGKAEEIQDVMSKVEGPITARGNGRCYGDAACGDVVISTKGMKKILDFDLETGIMTCESGLVYDELIQFAIPKGFFPPVTPGTKFITVGGALASDVHGKNHHVDGVFSDHVSSFQLLNSEGEIKHVTREQDLFYQTAGGMGLTGIILTITFKLKKIESSFIRQRNYKAKNLKHIFELFEEHQATPYSVAWIDCLTRGNRLGRSVLNIGDFALESDVESKEDKYEVHKKPSLNVPFNFPNWALNKLTVKAFNFLYYNAPRKYEQDYIAHYESFFYPLDKIHNWNRIYGKNGFVQYQFVLPKETAYDGITRIINEMAKRGQGSFLAVLKLFGKDQHERYLHFPMEGYTLAVDFKVSKKIFAMLDEFDKIVSEYGGRIYLTKDARMSAETFKKQYGEQPDLSKFASHQSKRLEMTDQKPPVEQNVQDAVLVLGANSDVAKAAIKKYIQKGIKVMAASRKTEALDNFGSKEGFSAELYTTHAFDAEKYESHKGFYEALPQKPTRVVYAAGFMSENFDAARDWNAMSRMINVNYSGAVSILNIIAGDEFNPGLKQIIGISSLAGVRARKSNYLYGSAKSAFSQYLYGLKQELADRKVQVNAVAPGFIKTKMTEGMELNEGLALTPEEVADTIVNAKKKFLIIPGFKWKIIYQIIKVLPTKMLSKL